MDLPIKYTVFITTNKIGRRAVHWSSSNPKAKVTRSTIAKDIQQLLPSWEETWGKILKIEIVRGDY